MDLTNTDPDQGFLNVREVPAGDGLGAIRRHDGMNAIARPGPAPVTTSRHPLNLSTRMAFVARRAVVDRVVPARANEAVRGKQKVRIVTGTGVAPVHSL